MFSSELDCVCSLLHNSAVNVCGAKVEGNRLLIELKLKMESYEVNKQLHAQFRAHL